MHQLLVNRRLIHLPVYEPPLVWFLREGEVVLHAHVFKSTHELSHETKALIDRITFGKLKMPKGTKLRIICDYPALVKRNYPLLNFVGNWTGKTDVKFETDFNDKTLKILTIKEHNNASEHLTA